MKKPQRQHGFIILLIVLMLFTIGGTVLLVALSNNQNNLSLRQTEITTKSLDVLSNARSALIGYSISVQGGGTRPGQLPPPDTLENGQYDGLADSNCLDGTNMSGATYLIGVLAKSANLRCVGRLPWKQLNLQLKNTSAQDILGDVPWYAASENLADPNFCMSVLNPNSASINVPMYSGCPNSVGPAWPWLKVCDSSGKILSDRVAFVLIAPGTAIQTNSRLQTRATISADPRNYLDDLPTPLGWNLLPPSSRCSTFDNAGLKGEFIIGAQSQAFNDRVSYVTIDELMREAEHFVASEAREAFLRYKTLTGGYPWLAPINNPSNPKSATLAVPNTLSGLLPFTAMPDGSNNYKFLTEISWALVGSGSDDLSGAAAASPTFFCYGGAYRCRLQTSDATPAPVSRTITTAMLRTNTITQPVVSCSYGYIAGTKKMNAINCDPLLGHVVSTPVSYTVQRQGCFIPYFLCSGGYSAVGVFSGLQTSLIDVSFSVVQPTGAPSPTVTPASSIATAKLTMASASNVNFFTLVKIQNNWSPPTGVPFDVSSGPFFSWEGKTIGNGTINLTVRAVPELPSWYASEKWYEFILAAVSQDSSPSSGISPACGSACLSSGDKFGLDVVVISSGAQLKNFPLPGVDQNRYVSNPTVGQFLEPPNADAISLPLPTRIFAQPNLKQSPTYADTISTIPR